MHRYRLTRDKRKHEAASVLGTGLLTAAFLALAILSAPTIAQQTESLAAGQGYGKGETGGEAAGGDSGGSSIWQRIMGTDKPSEGSGGNEFSQLDSNGDNSLDPSETKAQPSVDKQFTTLDINRDGKLSKAEFSDVSRSKKPSG